MLSMSINQNYYPINNLNINRQMQHNHTSNKHRDIPLHPIKEYMYIYIHKYIINIHWNSVNCETSFKRGACLPLYVTQRVEESRRCRVEGGITT